MTEISYLETESKRNEEKYRNAGPITQTLSPLTLSHGYPSLCILFSNLGVTDKEDSWIEHSNRYVQQIVNLISKRGIYGASLFSGTAGIAFSIRIASMGHYYSKLQKSLDTFLCNQVDEILTNLSRKTSYEMFDYDVIEGLAGIANYFFMVENDPTSEKYLKKILTYFVSLSGYKELFGSRVPNWHIQNEFLFSDSEKETYKDGVLNVGLSHGIPGPLIILSKAYKRGILVEGHFEAIKRIAHDLLKLKNHHDNNWGGMIGVEHYINQERPFHLPTRSAWCYGTPGTAFSLLTAAEALNDSELSDIAKQAMKDLIGNEQKIFSPSFCHGYAGISYLYKRFYEKTNVKEFHEESKRLKEKTIDFFNQANPFGFYDIEVKDNSILKLNSIGLLQGVTGILLTLLSFEECSPSIWNAAFLLDD
ncbi:lanthionine synthetase C family protein [Gracilibacillus saliphilus]|uniref:lanthionine synthetase C family protein n=1 Tax=Gracilibacillus saliphilus TaxID=543890 RepID=UPI002354E026|nr:lanthionine synthetase C family protein [Gracilibacillus saliphilus]